MNHHTNRLPCRPVELVDVAVMFAHVQIAEKFSQVIVIRRFEKVESSNVAQVGGKLFGQSLA